MWRTKDTALPVSGKKVMLRIRKYKGDIVFLASIDGGENWKYFQNGIRGAGGNITLWVKGEGKATFRSFKYMGIQEY